MLEMRLECGLTACRTDLFGKAPLKQVNEVTILRNLWVLKVVRSPMNENDRRTESLVRGGQDMSTCKVAHFCRDADELKAIVAHWRNGNTLRVGLTMGAFDLLHIGHLEYLEQARRLCDILVVGVDSNARVRKRKGPNRPFLDEAERVAMIRHVRHVDAVALKLSNAQRWTLVRITQPDVLIVSTDTYLPSELDALRILCPKVVVLERHSYASTSDPNHQEAWRNIIDP
jgi:cytidyltransferase-like protein